MLSKVIWTLENLRIQCCGQPVDCVLWFFTCISVTTSAEALTMNKYMSIKDLSIDNQASPQVAFIKLSFAKTDQFGQGCIINLARTDSDICPVVASSDEISLATWSS